MADPMSLPAVIAIGMLAGLGGLLIALVALWWEDATERSREFIAPWERVEWPDGHVDYVPIPKARTKRQPRNQ